MRVLHQHICDCVIHTCVQVVRKVEYHKKGVRVTTEDGSVYTADYVVVSVSLGVLQSELIKFVPDLPVMYIVSLTQLVP